MAPYPYKPVAVANEIRILTLQPGEYTDVITCSISHIAFPNLENGSSTDDDINSYEALTYCANKSVNVDIIPDSSAVGAFAILGADVKESGEIRVADMLDDPNLHSIYIRMGLPLPSGYIVCDGVGMEIGGELHRALKRIRCTDKALRLWIDAICINQLDTDERNRHALIMDKIYANAACVRVWLGEEIGIEQMALMAMSEITAIASDYIGESALSNISSPMEMEWKLRQDARTSAVSWESLIPFFDRAWFHSVWMTQQVANATKVLVHIGKIELDWDLLTGIISFAQQFKMDPVMQSEVFKPFAVMGWLRGNQGSADNKISIPLLEILEETRVLDSDLASDKIFAVLSMVNDPHDFVIDYSLDPEILFRNIAVKYLVKDKSLDILNYCTVPKSPSRLTLPTWVPDWTVAGWVEPLHRRGLKANAAGDTTVKLDVDLEMNILSISGRLLGTIAGVNKVKAIGPATDTESGGGDGGNLQTLIVSPEERNKARMESKRQNAMDTLRFTMEMASSSEKMAADVKQRLTRTLMCNKTRQNEDPNEDSIIGFEIYAMVTLSDDTINEVLRVRVGMQVGEDQVHEEAGQEFLQKAIGSFEMFFGAHAKWCHNRRFFMTSDGDFGWGINGITEDDIVVVFSGSDYPFVLRKQDSGYYKIIGDCYLDGYMNGEGISGGKEEQIFTIE